MVETAGPYSSAVKPCEFYWILRAASAIIAP